MPEVNGKKFPYTKKGKKAAKKAKKAEMKEEAFEKGRKKMYGLK